MLSHGQGIVTRIKQLKVPFKKELVPVPVPSQNKELVPPPVPHPKKGTSSSSSSFSSSFWGSSIKKYLCMGWNRLGNSEKGKLK